MTWQTNVNLPDAWIFDLGALGDLTVYNTEPTEPTGHWRAVWCNCNGDTGWDQHDLYSAADAQNAAEGFMVLAVLDARLRLQREGRLAALHADAKKERT